MADSAAFSASDHGGGGRGGTASFASGHITVARHPAERYAVITIAKEPVNSFDGAMWAGLRDAVRSVEADQRMAGLIIASGLKRDVFTAGNDLRELHAPSTSAARYAAFWIALSEALVGLFTSRLATVAALRGACPAGGCAIALCCDARIMTAAGSIGLNEVALGIPVPRYWAELMARVVGRPAAERLLLSGRMLSPPEAAAAGLVDELVPTGDELLPAARAALARMLAVHAGARSATKAHLRGTFGDAWLRYAREEEAAPSGYALIEDPGTVAVVGAAIARLSGRGSGGGSRQAAAKAKL